MASDNKYDRQLRLWGAHGQKALMETRILLVTASATGTETLKNLVLPGVGHVTVLDDALVTAADLGNNFFVASDSIGRPRAEVTCELLLEMNPDVQGEARVESIAAVLESGAAGAEWLGSFTLVVATQLPEATLRALGAILWDAGVPMVAARAYGLMGHVRLVTPEHLVVESKPDGDRTDLRVVNPFPELEEYCQSFDMPALDDMEHKHVPYVVLLWRALQEWKGAHDGQIPKSVDEKDQFKQLLKGASRDFSKEDNFMEAVAQAYRGYVPGEIPFEVQEIMDDARCTGVSATSDPFWVCAAALRAFVAGEGEGCLPVTGEVPDMVSTTAAYTRLQSVYQAKAARDRDAVTAHVATVLAGVGRPADSVPAEFIARFCKNTTNLLALRLRALDEELTAETANKDDMMMAMLMDAGPQNPLQGYLMLRVADRFHAAQGRFPGQCADDAVAADAAALGAIASQLREELSLDDQVLTGDHLAEVARYGACEVHNIAALVGGVASQEAVKLITHQFVPVNNTWLYNGIVGAAASWEL